MGVDRNQWPSAAGTRGGARSGIAAVLLVANDEARVAAALASVRWATAPIAVDLGSPDGSRRACEAHGARCVEPARVAEEIGRYGTEWVLLLEGHEEVPGCLADEIGAVVARPGADPGARDGYEVEREIRFLGRSLWIPAAVGGRGVRLLRRETMVWPRALVSLEAVRCGGRIGRLQALVRAEPYASLHHYLERIDVLTSALARVRHESGWRAGWVDMALRPAWQVTRMLPAAAVHGRLVGVIFALLEGYRGVLTAAKEWELARATNRPRGPG